MVRFRNVSAALFTLAALAFAGCAAKPSSMMVPADQYGPTFSAAREVLHSYRFTLDRIDARAGIITTRPKSSSGFFTPWDTEQSTISQEWEDTINHELRSVQVSFAPLVEIPEKPQTAGPRTGRDINADLLEHPLETQMAVTVKVDRVEQFGWRYNTKSVHLATLSENPALASNRTEVPMADDEYLAGRLVEQIRKRAAEISASDRKQSEQPASGPPPVPGAVANPQ
ncbi:MAG: hypothetical protein U0573_03525 [Phycisphaerales bacterium]|nr:hypothetical protein [Planctomycetota bacterium]